MDYIQDYSTMVAFFGFFSMAWFGWSQENPPKNWRKYIGILTGISLLIFLGGIYLSYSNLGAGSALDGNASMNNYFVFVVLEFMIAGIGAVILFRKNMRNYVAPWVCFIVGVHFFGLRYVFQDFSLHILGLLLVIVSGAAIYYAKNSKYTMPTITGISAGAILMAFALFNVFRLL